MRPPPDRTPTPEHRTLANPRRLRAAALRTTPTPERPAPAEEAPDQQRA